MKRPLALLISAGVTVFILSAVLAVAAPGLNASPTGAATLAPNVIVMTATPPPTSEAQSVEWEGGADKPEEDELQEGDDDQRPVRELEFKGVVEAMTEDALTVSGQVLLVTERSKIKRGIGVGSPVKVHARVLEDGRLWAKEVEPDD